MEPKYGINTGVIFISHEDQKGNLTDMLTDILGMTEAFYQGEVDDKNEAQAWDFTEYEDETIIVSRGDRSAKLYRMLQREFSFVKMEYARYENGFKELYPLCAVENDGPNPNGEISQLMEPWESEVIIRALQRAWQRAEAV